MDVESIFDSDEDDEKDGKDIATRLNTVSRIIKLIEKAEDKRVSKRKIIHFLKRKNVSETKINEAYTQYFHDEGLFEITFNERPLGFSVIMDTDGRNAIISSIQDKGNLNLGMMLGSYVYEVNGERVDDWSHKQILKHIVAQSCPLYIIFKEPIEFNDQLNKHYKRKLKKLRNSVISLTENKMKMIINTSREIDRLRQSIKGQTKQNNYYDGYIENNKMDHNVKISSLYISFLNKETCNHLVYGYLRKYSTLTNTVIPIDLFNLCFIWYYGFNCDEYETEIEILRNREEYLMESKIDLIQRTAMEMSSLRQLLRMMGTANNVK